MPRLSFTLRDVFWLMLVVALALGWWGERSRLAERNRALQYWHDPSRASFIAETFEKLLQKQGYTITYENGYLSVEGHDMVFSVVSHRLTAPIAEPVEQP